MRFGAMSAASAISIANSVSPNQCQYLCSSSLGRMWDHDEGMRSLSGFVPNVTVHHWKLRNDVNGAASRQNRPFLLRFQEEKADSARKFPTIPGIKNSLIQMPTNHRLPTYGVSRRALSPCL